MTLAGLLPLLTEAPEFTSVCGPFLATAQVGSATSTGKGSATDPVNARLTGPVRVDLPIEAAKPFVVAALAARVQRPVLVVVSDEGQAERFRDQLRLWLPGRIDALCFPDHDALPYESLPDSPLSLQKRLQVLAELARARKGGGEQPLPLLVSSVRALTQPLIPAHEFERTLQVLRVGEELDLGDLLAQLLQLGYEPVVTVEEPGSFSHRGGIVDIYPPSEPEPIRIEFFGDEIESIRRFDPETQRSTAPQQQAVIGPACAALPRHGPEAARVLEQLDLSQCTEEVRDRWERELENLREGRAFDTIANYLPYLHTPASLLDYLLPGTLLILDDAGRCVQTVENLRDQAEELRQQLEANGELPPGLKPGYFTWSDLRPLLASYEQVHFTSLFSDLPGQEKADPEQEYTGKGSALQTSESPLAKLFSAANSYGGRLKAAATDIRKLIKAGQRVIIVSAQDKRLSEVFGDEALLKDAAIHISSTREINRAPATGDVLLLHGQLAEGWNSATLGLTLLGDVEIFGWAKVRRVARRRPVLTSTFLTEVQSGDYVVHVEHGIGRFDGLVKMDTIGVEREYLLIQYAGTDRLYIPTDQLDRVTKYIAMGDTTPALSRLGTTEWTRAKSKVKASVQDIARELLQLYSVRESIEGFAYSADQPWQRELEDSFPYIETADQQRAIDEVKTDMERPRPMDRLVCGDVGYGKTEVALRAAFKAVLDQRQVGILVPTTVLALQHYNTFRQRMQAFPVRVEVLSRFRSEKEQQQVLEDLALGKIDILIGTHRLLQKDVVFHDLGLLIIDEEHRFGVAQKEQLKQVRHEVDVLTLTATPIPRTLHMSLVNIRDVSVIETPPNERLPIHTAIHVYDDALVREAILREMDRGGQIFFVHNRVQGIQVIAQRLVRLVPEARICVGHGQMHEDQLEKVMLDFSNGDYDVLVCTTIIESGLDLPNVNTIIINQAPFFGLAQLYQLRGRVGRSSNQAYAYFLYNRDTRLTPTAEKRLRAIFEASELGAGFKIAMHDLEIRGAGNLLGGEQHGFMNSVGFDLYCKLLAEAVQELQGKKETTRPSVAIDLPIDAYVPDSYIENRTTKMSIYQRISLISTKEQVEEIATELKDRFGEPPLAVQNLLTLLRLKIQATEAGIESIGIKYQDVQILLRRTAVANRVALYKKFHNDARVTTGVVSIPRKFFTGETWIKQLYDLLPLITSKPA